MSIYDEAIETLENSKACTGYPCDYPNVIQALERAKKEHELLELYRKHMTTLCKNTREGVKDSMFSAEYVAYEVYQQIKALEEELK